MGAHLVDPRATIPKLQAQIDELQQRMVDLHTQLAQLTQQVQALARDYESRWYQRFWRRIVRG